MRRKLFLLIPILPAILIAFLLANRFTLTIRLNGETAPVLEYGETYMEQGAEVLLSGRFIWKEGITPKDLVLQILGEVEENRIGRYPVTYQAEYLWFQAEAERIVTVVDTQLPEIILNPDPEETPEPGEIYEEAGFRAVDNYDGDITHKVVRREFMGKITYAVTDSSGNPAYAERQVPYHDPVPPEIFLEGGEMVSVPVGGHYREPGYTAHDNVDGDLTNQVTVEGSTDWLTPGSYPITYSVTDAYQNTTVVTRTVQIVAAERPETVWPENKTVYLTFDDGPGPYTEQLLDLLDRYGVKATFFVVDGAYNHLLKEIVDRGHSIGIHSVTHNYAQIYASPEAYFQDLYRMQQIIYDSTGVWTTMMRFPGGSSNEVSSSICPGIMTLMTEAVQDAGYQYFDWNVDSSDAVDAFRKDAVLDNVVEGVLATGIAVVLQHDIHAHSVAAVEEILQWGLDNGYTFQPLRPDSPGFHHPLNN